MKRIFCITALVLLLLMVFFSQHLVDINAEKQADVFIIQNADGSNTIAMTGSSVLTSLIQNAELRFVLQYANAKNIVPITSPPANLITSLQSTGDRFVVQYANGKHVHLFITPPPSLVNLLQTASDRFIMQYANAIHKFSLSYPSGLVNDTTAPVIEQISILPVGKNINLTLQTNEYTLAQLDYGLTSGVYTQSLIDDEYHFEHTLVINGLQSNTIYYYRITVTDRSGNTAQSNQGTLQSVTLVYLPLLEK